MKLYMRVTDDQYELPIAVADTHGELARMCGVSRNTVASALSHARRNGQNSVYKEVEVEDGSDDS